MSLSLRFAAGSHKGMIREGNEDSGYAGPRLLAIADGMGGQAAGEVASSEVISTLVGLDDDVPGSDILTSLGEAVQRANDQLRVMVEEDPQLEGMGTTLTALLWTGQRLGLVHIGDSRGYLLRDGVLSQITQDHTWVQRLVDEGRITEEEAGTHPQRSLLMRALDGRGQVEPDLSIREVRAGDRYLICSDGLSGVVSHQTLEETLAGYQGPYETVQDLIQLALRGGGPDNITCIVADVYDTGDGGGVHDEHPVVVGAVAEHPHALADQSHLQTPAGRAAELSRAAQPPAPQAPDGSFGPPDSGMPAGASPLGSFGPPGEGGHAKPRAKRGWPRRAGIGVLALAVAGGGLYWGYSYTQSQYYVGANGDHVAVYQGLSQSLLGLNLSKVHTDRPDIPLKYLPTYQRGQVERDISATSLSDAAGTAGKLHDQVVACELKAGTGPGGSGDSGEPVGSPSGSPTATPSATASGHPSGTPLPNTHSESASGGPKPSASVSPGPTLTAEQQKLAEQCSSGQ